jgi:cobalt-zinc-cadmium efflux system membrane fusion protein
MTMDRLTRRRAIAAILGAAAIAGAGAWWAFGAGKRASVQMPVIANATVIGTDRLRYPDGAPQLTLLRGEAVTVAAMPVSEPLPARLAYDENVTSRVSAAFAGRIVALFAEPGTRVAAGQALAQVDSPDYGTAAADFAKAHADEERKRLAFERARELMRGEAIARKDLEAAQADWAQARAETERALLRVRNLNPREAAVTGQRFPLVSPLAGVVTERTANPGMEVNPSLTAPLFVVTDLSRLWLVIDLPERLLGAVKPGAAVEVEVDAWPGERFPATVAQVGLMIDPSTRRVPVRAKVDNTAMRLRPEMFARATLVAAGPANAVRVPNGAVVTEGVFTYVFVQSMPNEFRRRAVTVARRGGEYSFVSEGLAPGERVVVSGALLLASELRTDARPAS